MLISAALLAGGKSSRMQQDKALLPWGTTTVLTAQLQLLAAHFTDIMLVGDQPRQLPASVRQIPDNIKNAGPLSALEAALTAARNPAVFIISCDMPFITSAAIAALTTYFDPIEHMALVPFHDRLQPLCAIYHTRVLPPLLATLEANRYGLTAFCQALPCSLYPPSTWPAGINLDELFFNMNTPADYQLASAQLRKK